MTVNNKLLPDSKQNPFDFYYETFYHNAHARGDYQKISQGYREWYYDCLPEDREARILDIGCGDGKFLFFLQTRGYSQVEGLEVCARLAQESQKYVDFPVHAVEDTVLFLDANPASYQTITMNDVLEHVPREDTIRFLASVKRALLPGGNAIINVPQVSGISSLYCRYNDFTHQTIYTAMSLRQVMMLAGFTDIRYIKENWLLRLTPRHMAYRSVRWIWYTLLRLIYFIELPTEIHPQSFQTRLVASASCD